MSVLLKIQKDIENTSQATIRDFQLIREKSGVHVYRCIYNSVPAVVKYFDNKDDSREILNYRILARHNIPTIKALALGDASVVLEDITVSQDWRLGIAEDLADTCVAECLAHWYFRLHERGTTIPELDTLFFELDSITKENLHMLMQKIPEGEELFRHILTRYDKLKEIIYTPPFTLTYNDFYWTNLVVRKDKTAAKMFDYNLLGKGYRHSDFTNVCGSMSSDAATAFTNEYNSLYKEAHGHDRNEAHKVEAQINDIAAPLYALIVAFTQRENLPSWAMHVKNKVIDGSLLDKARLLL